MFILANQFNMEFLAILVISEIKTLASLVVYLLMFREHTILFKKGKFIRHQI